MKVTELLDEMTEKFAAAGIESPRADAEILLGFVIEATRGEILALAVSGREVTELELESITPLVERRVAREPLQHLTGVAYFRQLELEVGPGVFVPRFETETVVQSAIDFLVEMKNSSPVVVDLATGSGAIALSIATEIPNAKVFAIELSEVALNYTKKNFSKYAPEAVLAQGDLFEAFPELDGLVDLVISNPPYIPNQMVPIYPEVHLHDPALALYGGSDGLDIIRRVEQVARRLLREGGKLVVEHADMQAESCRQVFSNEFWTEITTSQDLAGRDRMVSATKGRG
ncbi:MAG: peptide chain release factor N(5)-glutamine methyltransferase [Microbacteriaceae bacterium]|nr:peptide chain release factor N(5)-glutamine methyltransferase [Microbacteriaceae bacterium]